MKEYRVKARIDGIVREEDPKCPWEWRGSGCYDIDVEKYCYIKCSVFAESEEEVKDIVGNGEFDGCQFDKIIDVIIYNIEVVSDDASPDERGIGDVCYEESDYTYPNEIDPDDYHDRQMLGEI